MIQAILCAANEAGLSLKGTTVRRQITRCHHYAAKISRRNCAQLRVLALLKPLARSKCLHLAPQMDTPALDTRNHGGSSFCFDTNSAIWNDLATNGCPANAQGT